MKKVSCDAQKVKALSSLVSDSPVWLFPGANAGLWVWLSVCLLAVVGLCQQRPFVCHVVGLVLGSLWAGLPSACPTVMVVLVG